MGQQLLFWTGIIFLIFLFIAVFALALRKIINRMIDKRIERFQSELIEKQIREVQNMYQQMRGWRHDYRNHIQNMKIMLHEHHYDKLDSYLSELADDLTTVDTVVKTGNVMADAILNSKLSVAKREHIRLNVKANIPAYIPMTDVELCAVLGNLLDNAMEACRKLPEGERFMRVYIGCLKKQLYLSVQNSAGTVKKIGGIYFSTKSRSADHGYGLFRIDRITDKYGGYVNRQNEEGVFATEIMIPISQ